MYFSGEKRQGAKKNKAKLQRTSSVIPGDISSNKDPVASSKPDRDEQFRQNEEKFNKLRKQLEIAEKAEAESAGTVMSNLDVHPGYIDPLPAHNPGSKSVSPIPRVEKPPQIVKPRQEQLITGHLLVAKKLSDESIDHKLRLTENGDSEDEESVVQGMTDQTGHLAVAGQMGSVNTEQSGNRVAIGRIEPAVTDKSRYLPKPGQIGQVTSDPVGHQLKSRQTDQLRQPSERQQLQQLWSSDCSPKDQRALHSKLSRQMSLAGNQDPRLRPKIQQQLSVDPQLLSGTTRSLPMNRMQHEVGMYSAVEPDRIASFPMNATDHPVYYSHPGQTRNDPYYGNMRTEEIFHSGDQTTMAQMMHSPHLDQLVKGPQRGHMNQHGIVRQNSNSDSQLHMIGLCDGDPFSSPYAYNQCGTVYEDMHNDPPGYQTALPQQSFYRSTSMIQSQFRPSLVSRSARHYSDGRFSGGIDQPQSNHPYIQPSHMYTHPQPQPQFMTSDQQFASPHLQMNYQSVSGPAQHLTEQSVTGHNAAQLPSRSVWSDSPYVPQVSHMRSPMPDDTEIKPADSRYNLYYHLCGLFPEPKVRAVMNQHPNETNPQELCAYIIGAK